MVADPSGVFVGEDVADLAAVSPEEAGLVPVLAVDDGCVGHGLTWEVYGLHGVLGGVRLPRHAERTGALKNRLGGRLIVVVVGLVSVGRLVGQVSVMTRVIPAVSCLSPCLISGPVKRLLSSSSTSP